MERRAAWAPFIGNFVERFDYASYGYLAITIGEVFFPASAPNTRLLAAFAVFAASFTLRPVGAIVWGAWGDRRGCKWALSRSIPIMAASTMLVGCLRDTTGRYLGGYRAAPGAHAPGLLRLRRIRRGRHLPGGVRPVGAPQHLRQSQKTAANKPAGGTSSSGIQPLRKLLRHHRGAVLTGFGVLCLNAVAVHGQETNAD
ncbi:hypothetical protein [Actinomyces ruminis]|uniref:hypothetical protein n=1 Tax=Actinomyces ruminis TaxID=1937003 RepID=UPI0011780A92